MEEEQQQPSLNARLGDSAQSLYSFMQLSMMREETREAERARREEAREAQRLEDAREAARREEERARRYEALEVARGRREEAILNLLLLMSNDLPSLKLGLQNGGSKTPNCSDFLRIHSGIEVGIAIDSQELAPKDPLLDDFIPKAKKSRSLVFNDLDSCDGDTSCSFPSHGGPSNDSSALRDLINPSDFSADHDSGVDDVSEVSEWLKWPDGDRTVLVRAPYGDIVSTGYVWCDISHKGGVSRGPFSRKKECHGIMKCSRNCGYSQRPYLPPKKQTNATPPKKHYRKKDYRNFCHGLCAERGDLEVPLVHEHCTCVLVYMSSGNGIVSVSHLGTHTHARPPVVRITASEYRTYENEAKDGTRVSPKKKFSPQAPVTQIQMW